MPAPPVTIYVTSLTSQPKVRQHIGLLHRALGALDIPYESFDLATDEDAKRRWQRAKPPGQVIGLPGYLVGGEWLGTMDEFEEAVEMGYLESFLKQDVQMDDPNQSIGDAEIDRLMREMTDEDLDQLAGHFGAGEALERSSEPVSTSGAAATGVAGGLAAAGAAVAASKVKGVRARDAQAGAEETSAPKEKEKEAEVTTPKAAAKELEPLQPAKEAAKAPADEPSPVAKATKTSEVDTSSSTMAAKTATPSSNADAPDPHLVTLVEQSAARAHARTPTEDMASRAAAIAAADAALREMQDEDDYAAPDDRAKDYKATTPHKAPTPLHPKEKEERDAKKLEEDKAAEAAREKEKKEKCDSITKKLPTDEEVEQAAAEAASRAAHRTHLEECADAPPINAGDLGPQGILSAASAALASVAAATEAAVTQAAEKVTQAAESAVPAVENLGKAASKFAGEASGVDAEDAPAEPRVKSGPAPGEKTLDEVIDETMAKEDKEEKRKEEAEKAEKARKLA